MILLLLAVQLFSTVHLGAQLPEATGKSDFKRDIDRQVNAMGVFGYRLASLGGKTSVHSKSERWQHTFRDLDRLNEQPEGTCEKQLPQLANFILQNPGSYAPVILASAHLINQSVAQAEKLALKTASTASDKALKYHCLLIATTCAVERGDIKTALKRLETLAEIAPPETDLGKWASVQTLVVKLHEISGHPDRMPDTLRGLVNEHRRQLGETDSQTLFWHNMLANALYLLGKVEDSEKEFTALLKLLTAKYGPDAEQTKVIARKLSQSQSPPPIKKPAASSAVEENQGERKELLRHEQAGIDHFHERRFVEAAREFLFVVAAKIRREGPESLGAVITQNNLGAVLHELGRNEEAVTLLREVLRIREEKFPEDKISQMEVRNNLGNALRGLGKHQESVQQHRLVATTHEKLLGPNSIATIDAWNNLAGGLDDIGELDEGETVAAKAVAGRLKVQGPDHPATLGSRQVLASLMALNGKRNAAKLEYENILAVAEKAFGSENVETVQARKNLGHFLSQQGEFQESLKHLEKAHQTSLKLLGENNPLTEECSTLMMTVLVQSKQSDNPALDKAHEELQASEKSRVAEDARTLDLRLRLGQLLLQSPQTEAAEKEFQKLIAILKKQDALGSRTGLEARRGMAEVQRLTGNLEAAETAHREIFQEAVTSLGEHHAFSLECKSQLATTVSDAGRDPEAMNLLHEILAARIKTMGEEAEAVFATYYQMATCMLKMKRLMEARSFATQAAAGYAKVKGPYDAQTQKAKNLVTEMDLAGFRPPDLRRIGPASFINQTPDLDAPPAMNPFSIQAPPSLLPVDINSPTSGSR
ncbi:MAG: tetratricopeptide repeat protein [Verrucomicrobiota bacterium]